MIIDASDMILGRLATYIAKKALLGEKVDIVNCEKAVITGDKKSVFEKYKKKNERGSRPTKGPFMPKMPDRFVRRCIRGMLPYKQEKGIKAFRRVMCYIGIPDEFKDKKIEVIQDCNVSKVPSLKYVYVNEICSSMKERK
ncbi:50S ribosomal protein L13 [Candidatus Woesearchaeota archaeon]|nr:50S ribosomal protein L13 [Candidatus Woesearchaeota archaeon]